MLLGPLALQPVHAGALPCQNIPEYQDLNCNTVSEPDEQLVTLEGESCTDPPQYPNADYYYDYYSFGCLFPAVGYDADEDGLSAGTLELFFDPKAAYPDLIAILGCDNCPDDYNPDQYDTDCDGIGDICDVCPDILDNRQENHDGDAHGSYCDNCPFDPTNLDTDGDTVCDDGDGSGTPGDNPCDLNDATAVDAAIAANATLGSGAAQALAVAGPGGAPATPHAGSMIAIDGHGDIVVANRVGVHLITRTGLAPGQFPWLNTNKWAPARACHRPSVSGSSRPSCPANPPTPAPALGCPSAAGWWRRQVASSRRSTAKTSAAPCCA